MKILHIITSLLDGGAEGVLYQLCCNDKTNQHIVVSLKGRGKYGKLLSKHNIKIYTLNMKPEKFSLISLFKLIKILRKEKADIIQTWLYHADFFGSIAAKLSGFKNLVWNIRHSNFNEKYTKKNLKILIKLLAKLSHLLPKKIIFCSKNAMKLHIKIGYEACKMRYIPNGYDLQKFKPQPRKLILKKKHTNKQSTILGCVARFHPQKDHNNLLHALSILKKKKLVFKCILAGLGLNKKNIILTKLIKKLNLYNEIILLGPQENINRIMKKIDIHILASEFGEAFPNVVAEAMACGTPCVVTDVGDSSLIVGKTGWVVKPSNPELLAKSLIKALKFSKLKKWNHQCLSARNRIANKFPIQKMIYNYNKVWKETIKN